VSPPPPFDLSGDPNKENRVPEPFCLPHPTRKFGAASSDGALTLPGSRLERDINFSRSNLGRRFPSAHQGCQEPRAKQRPTEACIGIHGARVTVAASSLSLTSPQDGLRDSRVYQHLLVTLTENGREGELQNSSQSPTPILISLNISSMPRRFHYHSNPYPVPSPTRPMVCLLSPVTDDKCLQPQRLVRAPLQAAHGNENIIPAKQLGHQRHKSAGNLKTMAVTGALNVPAKRTAFGDVSNMARPLAEIAGKNGVKIQGKSIVGTISRNVRTDDKENSQANVGESWARPTAASRASFTSKYLSAAPISATNSAQGNRPSLRTHSSSIQASSSSQNYQAPAKSSLLKKATAVYFDKETDVAIRADVHTVIEKASATAAQDDTLAKNPRHYKSQPVLRTDQPNLRRTQSRYLGKNDKVTEVDMEIPDDITEAAYEDALEQFVQDVQTFEEQVLLESELVPKHGQQVEFDVDQHIAPSPETIKSAMSISGPASAPSESEYWEEEDDQDLYDEHGYTTAHSYRSHGDNTTGGPTTLFAPKVSVNVERELEVAKQYVLETTTEEELEEESWDVSMVAEYGDEIFEYMRKLEVSDTHYCRHLANSISQKNLMPNPYYMDIQTEIRWSMRSVLMDWLVQVHHRFALLPETLFLTVNYIDRFLSVKIVSLNKLQLVGATAIFLAAKYEEINCPSVQEIVYMVDKGYTPEEVLKAERFMLSMLQFELGWPGPMSFLRRISKADDYDLETRTLAKYFLEVTIMDERFVGSPPSFIAAGAHCLARLMLKKGDWVSGS